MTPSQIIRSMLQPCRLAGLEREHAEAVSAGDDAPLEVAIDLVDALLGALEAQLPEPPPRRRRHLADRIRELAAGGKSDPAIALELGLAVEAVRSQRRWYDIPAGVVAGGQRSGWEDQVRKLHGEGKTMAEIAEALGWTPRTTQQRLYMLGLSATRRTITG